MPFGEELLSAWKRQVNSGKGIAAAISHPSFSYILNQPQNRRTNAEGQSAMLNYSAWIENPAVGATDI
jgi:hypothetical protein